MKTTLLLIALLIAATVAFADGLPQTTCPVMGGKINTAQYADVKGKRVYVCCGGCISKIKADPDTYIQKLEAEGVELEKAPEG